MILLNQSWPCFFTGSFYGQLQAEISAASFFPPRVFLITLLLLLLLHPGTIQFLCLCKVLLKAVMEQHKGTLKLRSAYFVMNESSQM